MAVEPRGWVLEIWSRDGTLRRRARLPLAPTTTLVSLAARPTRLLLAVSDPAAPGLTGVVIDLPSATLRRRVELPFPLGRVFAAPQGWLVEGIGAGTRPSLLHLDDHGTLGRELPTPEAVWARAQALGKTFAAVLGVVTSGDRIWGVPAGFYEFWNLAASPPTTISPPACLALEGHLLDGATALAKLRWLAGDDGDVVARQLETELASRLGTVAARGHADPARRRRNSFFPAVLSVASEGSTVAVLLDVEPERPAGGCRLDLWDLAKGRLEAAVPLAGPCPRAVALAAGTVWLQKVSNRLAPLPPAALRPPPPCATGTTNPVTQGGIP